MRKVIFTVSGAGSFPVDMLRYDCCYHPYASADATNIMLPMSRRSVTLIGERITPARWESFMWRVISSKELKA